MYKSCSELQSEHYNLFCNYNQNNNDMEIFKKDYNLDEDITGLIGIIDEGEIIELWQCTSLSPWNLNTDYEKVF